MVVSSHAGVEPFSPSRDQGLRDMRAYANDNQENHHMLASNLLRVSVIIILFGMLMGIGMGMTQDFRLQPDHAHLNLLGFVSLFLAGLYYQAVPQATASMLATWHASIAVLGAIVFPIGIAIVVLAGQSYIIFPIVGSLIAVVGMILFAIIVFRFGAPLRA